MKKYYYVTFSGGGIERVGDIEFEDSVVSLAKKCKGELSGSGFGFGVRDYSFTFKTEKSALKFYAQLGRRARAWRISNREVSFVTELDNNCTFSTLAKS